MSDMEVKEELLANPCQTQVNLLTHDSSSSADMNDKLRARKELLSHRPVNPPAP